MMKNKLSTNHDDMIMHCSTFDELLDMEYGNPRTSEREKFDTEAAAFCIAETLKEETLNADTVTAIPSELPHFIKQ